MSSRFIGCVAWVVIVGALGVVPCHAEFDTDEYRAFLESVQDQTTGELIDAHAPYGPFTSEVPGDPLSAEYLDAIIDHYGLTEGELALLEENGFMVSERLRRRSYGIALDEIWHADLPVFVSTDMILHAVHRSYVNILSSLETVHLSRELRVGLAEAHAGWHALDEAYGDLPGMRESLDDVDVYLTVARSLATGVPRAPEGDNQTVVDELLALCAAELPASYPLFNEVPRLYDFSQLKPRGNYTTSETLERYFRAMMWLGRTELRMSLPEGTVGGPEDVTREIIDAFLMRELLARGGGDELEGIDAFLRQLVGQPDNVTLPELDRLAAAVELDTVAQLLDPAMMTAVEDELATGDYRAQAILSQILMADPGDPEPILPPYAFLVMGQRFILDSYIAANVVYDRIVYEGESIFRGLPDPLDVLFALGNDDAVLLLGEELDEYHYAANLSALRYLIDGYGPETWEESLYTVWLQAIRLLADTGQDEGVPDFMRTGAWQQQKMNTQLASWTELRHDNLLYAKQSYTGGSFCSFPYGYVEPVPDFYRHLADFAARGAVTFAGLPPGSWEQIDLIDDFFLRMEEIMNILAGISEKELAGTELTDEECQFLENVLYLGGCAGDNESGWYRDLFFDASFGSGLGAPASLEDLLVADVHTQPTDQVGSPVGKILHVGTGHPELGVYLAAPPGRPLTAFVGPTASFHEYVTMDFERLTDEEWEDLYDGDTPPTRPEWTFAYLADADGAARSGPEIVDEVTPILPPEAPPSQDLVPPSALVLAQNRPNPFGASTVIGFRVSNAAGREVTLRVYDVLGREVVRLVDERVATGAYFVRWDGVDRFGTTLPSGTYVAELRMGTTTETRLMTLVR